MDNATVPTIPNETSLWFHCEFEKWFRRVYISLTLFYSLIYVCGVIGNGLVIFIIGFRMKKSFTTVFFLNLAIADFIVTFLLIVVINFYIRILSYSRQIELGEEMCRFISTIKLMNLYSSVFFLMVISIGRYISVRFPVWSRNHQTPQLASLVALCVWILSLALSCAYLHSDIGWGNVTETLSEDIYICHGSYIFLYNNITYSLPMILSHVILSFILPFIVMISCYGATILRLRESQFAQRGKPFKAIIAVTVAFFVCWFPLNLVIFMKRPHFENCALPKFFLATKVICDLLAYVNSCLNPFLYVFIGRHYRERLRCSLLAALENAFREENSPDRTRTEDKSTATAESQNL